MSHSVAVMTDTNSGLTPEQAKELNEKIAHNYLMYSQWYKEE